MGCFRKRVYLLGIMFWGVFCVQMAQGGPIDDLKNCVNPLVKQAEYLKTNLLNMTEWKRVWAVRVL